MIRLLVDDRKDKIKNNISFEPYKRPIKNFKGNGFDIQFLGIDKDGYEIYQGNKDSWKNFINYLFDIYNKNLNYLCQFMYNNQTIIYKPDYLNDDIGFDDFCDGVIKGFSKLW